MAIETNSAQGTVESWERLIEVHWSIFNLIEKFAMEMAAKGDTLEAAECERIASMIADRGRAIEDAPPVVAVHSDADASYLMKVLRRAAAPTCGDREPWIRTMATASLAPLECWLDARRAKVAPAGTTQNLPATA